MKTLVGKLCIVLMVTIFMLSQTLMAAPPVSESGKSQTGRENTHTQKNGGLSALLVKPNGGQVRAVPNKSGGYTFYNSKSGLEGRSQANHSGGHNYFNGKGGMVGRTVISNNGVITFRPQNPGRK